MEENKSSQSPTESSKTSEVSNHNHQQQQTNNIQNPNSTPEPSSSCEASSSNSCSTSQISIRTGQNNSNQSPSTSTASSSSTCTTRALENNNSDNSASSSSNSTLNNCIPNTTTKNTMESSASSSSSSSSSSSVQSQSKGKSSKDSSGKSQPPTEPEDLPQNRIRRGVVCEAWQSTKSCLKERISYLFNNDTLSDVLFLVGRNRVRIPGHKFVLSISSRVFDCMFNGPLQERAEIELPDLEPEAFLALLKFLYSDEVSVSAESVLTVLYTAKKYAVPTLEEHCVAFLKDNLTAENAFLLLSQARLFDEPQLAALCLDCIDKNTVNAVNADGFTEVDISTLSAVLERDTLRIREFTLFGAVLRWAAQECTRRGLDVTPQNQRYVLGRALSLIRFPLMPVEEFAIGVAQLGILSENELVRLFLHFNISSTNLQHRPDLEFIDRPRCYMTGKQLSVYRFQQVETRWGYNGLSDQIRFTTDRRIYLVGYGMYGGLFGTKEYRVDIQVSNTGTNTVLGHHSDTFLSDGSKSTFKIMFKEPIEILPDVLYTASATLRGPDSHYGAKGQRKVGIECPDGTTVTFTFSYSSDNNNGTSVEDGQLPELIFHT